VTKRRYHRDIGFPHGIILRPPPLLRWSRHALEQLHQDGFHGDHALKHDAVCIEVTMEDEQVSRWLMRQSLTAQCDLCLVVDAGGIVITCWMNQRGDTHRTLDRRQYAVPLPRCPECGKPSAGGTVHASCKRMREYVQAGGTLD
jgi:ribosomal protein L32